MRFYLRCFDKVRSTYPRGGKGVVRSSRSSTRPLSTRLPHCTPTIRLFQVEAQQHIIMSLKRKAADLTVASVAAGSSAKKSKADAPITSFFGQPKNNNTSKHAPSTESTTESTTKSPTSSGGDLAKPVVSTFDKEAWLATLSDETKSLLQLEIHTLHHTWLAALRDDLTTPSFLELKRFLKREAEAGHTIFPPSADVYAWSRHTPLPAVKAVILGQDPYHNYGQAHGLCFSVRPPTKAPPSLKNIYTALKHDQPSFRPPPRESGLLTPWADRGVLLLNTCLTVRAHAANSHANHGWEKFTRRVLEVVAATRTRGVVFLAWGKPAQSRCARLNFSRHLLLTSVHPSPLSAHRGFFECGHFNKTNEWLRQRYGADGVIDWDLNVAPEETGT